MSRRLALLTIGLAALLGLGGLVLCAPGYLTAQGFPLDDAWIHAVYARELARSGVMAYNPGIPATGSTAPLWSLLVAVPHLFSDGPAVVVWVKVLGFLCHVLTAMLFFAALRDGSAEDVWAWCGALLIALHPDLLSASVSGMETPLATLAAAVVLYATTRGSAAACGASVAAAFLVRPELAVVGLTLPLIGSGTKRRTARNAGAVALALTAALALLALRNLAASGWPLPAAFYAKVGGGPPLLEALSMGFTGLLRRLPVVNSLLLLVALLGIACALLRDRGISRAARAAAASLISGLAFCAVSFALVAPVDPEAFYHQRYVLPALPLLIGPLPVLLASALSHSMPLRAVRLPVGVAVLLCVIGLARSAPARFAHLASDARNIDDVQVALGRHLAGASADDVVWAVDAGAVRYFGNAFVVDMMGLNTPQLLDRNAQAFLDAHRPRWIEVIPEWSSLVGETGAGEPAALFEPSSPYTVTSFPAMRSHRLVPCAWQSSAARFAVRSRVFDIACAPEAPDTSLATAKAVGTR